MIAILMSDKLKKLIDTTRAFMGDSPHRPVQQYIQIRFDKGTNTARAVAVDGYKLALETVDCVEIDEDFTVYVKPTLPPIKKSIINTATVELKEGKCLIEVGNQIAGCKQPEGEFFDADKFIAEQTSEPPKFNIGFNSEYLTSALKATQISNGTLVRYPAIMEFRGSRKPVLMWSMDKRSLRVVLPIRINGGEEYNNPESMEEPQKKSAETVVTGSDA